MTPLGPGDVYIQNGAIRGMSWDPKNPSHEVFVIVGAKRDESVGHVGEAVAR